jgi:hypothetical protein
LIVVKGDNFISDPAAANPKVPVAVRIGSAIGFAAIVGKAVLVPRLPSFSLNERRVIPALASASLTKSSNINFLN